MVESSNFIECRRVVFGSGIRGVKEKPRLRKRGRKPQMRPEKGEEAVGEESNIIIVLSASLLDRK